MLSNNNFRTPIHCRTSPLQKRIRYTISNPFSINIFTLDCLLHFYKFVFYNKMIPRCWTQWDFLILNKDMAAILEKLTRPSRTPEIDQLRTSLPIIDQLTSTPPLGERLLLSQRTAKDLQPFFKGALAVRRFPRKEQDKLLGIYALMEESHQGQTRRTGANFAVHPARVAIRDALDPTVTPLQLAIDLGHDLLEDCDLSPKDVRDLYVLKGYRPKESDLIVYGIMLQSKSIINPSEETRFRKKTDYDEYLNKLLIAHPVTEAIQPIRRKISDSYDSVLDDWLRLVTEGNIPPENATPLDPHRIRKFLLTKVSSVVDLTNTYNNIYPTQPIDATPLIRAASGCLESCNDKLSKTIR